MTTLHRAVVAGLMGVGGLMPTFACAAEKQLSCEVTVFTGEIGTNLRALGGKRLWRVAFDDVANSARMVEFVPVNYPPVHEQGDAVVITADSVSFCLANDGCTGSDIERVSINRRTGDFRWVYYRDHGETIESVLTSGKCKPYVEPKQQF
jgi:hypothetical protein